MKGCFSADSGSAPLFERTWKRHFLGLSLGHTSSRYSSVGLFLVLSLSCFCLAESNPSVQFDKVIVRPGDTLWGIAQTYLKNPANWDQIIKYNRLPSSDPTVALPGMVLKVPRKIMKERRAGSVISAVNQVLLRRRETARWRPVLMGMDIYSKDTLRTLEESNARVRFVDAEILDVEANSLAVINLPAGVKREESISLKKGSVFVGHARVITAAASITPKVPHTVYAAKIQEDDKILIRVYSGIATVSAQGQKIDLPEGMETTVPPGLAPGLPKKIPHWKEFKARVETAMKNSGGGNSENRMGVANLDDSLSASGGEKASQASLSSAGGRVGKAVSGVKVSGRGSPGEDLQAEVENLAIGAPISGYRLQASISRDFSSPLVDKVFDPDEKVDIQDLGLKPGVYWFRLSMIDLLGTPSPFTHPRRYVVSQ